MKRFAPAMNRHCQGRTFCQMRENRRLLVNCPSDDPVRFQAAQTQKIAGVGLGAVAAGVGFWFFRKLE
jgi:hypothetical protein